LLIEISIPTALSAEGAMMNTEINLPCALISRLRRQLRSVLGTLALLFSLGAAQSALATVTVLTFDELSDGTILTTQYGSLGVTAAGVTIIDSLFVGAPPISAPNFAYAHTGLMTFSLNSAIMGDIYTVSSYVIGPTNTGVYAYDNLNNLLGQIVLAPGSPANTLLSFTSSGNSIARLEIHDGGSSFFIDNLTFATRSTVPEPASLWLMGLGLLGLLAATRRRTAITHAG
jgi:hypothetical protein